VKKEAIVKIM